MSDTTTPAARHALYAALEGAIGKPHADTLMTYLPAHRSNEAATKADVEILEDRFDRLEDRFDRLEDRFDHWQRTTLVVVVSAMTGLTAIFSAIVLIAS
ncbi:MAG: hypothetical protein AB1Z55_05035 [Acidimicrobiia bacterium]